MVVTEALARGLPVLATEVGGLPEALGHAPGRRPAGPAGRRPATRPRWPPRCAAGSPTPALRARLRRAALGAGATP